MKQETISFVRFCVIGTTIVSASAYLACFLATFIARI